MFYFRQETRKRQYYNERLVQSGEMNCASVRPQSVFNTQNANMVQFLEDQYQKHQRGEETLVYPHQVEAVRRLREYFDPEVQNDPNASNIALVVLPTGCGNWEDWSCCVSQLCFKCITCFSHNPA